MAIDPRFLAERPKSSPATNCWSKAASKPRAARSISGYPGSPVAGFFDALGDIQTAACGEGRSRLSGQQRGPGGRGDQRLADAACRGLIAMKSVGVHVAADALALGNLAGAHPEGGAVIIMGDDPWCESTQVPADSRFICEHLRMPVVEPGGPQELKDWIDLSLQALAGGRAVHRLHRHRRPGRRRRHGRCAGPTSSPSSTPSSALTLDTQQDRPGATCCCRREPGSRSCGIPERFAQDDAGRARAGDQPDHPATAMSHWHEGATGFGKLGRRSASSSPAWPAPYLEHVLADLGLAGVFPILQMGMSYPADVRAGRASSPSSAAR